MDHNILKPEWLGLDDMADIRPGSKLIVHRRGLEVTGTTHEYFAGAWFTQEGGLLLVAEPECQWRFA